MRPRRRPRCRCASATQVSTSPVYPQRRDEGRPPRLVRARAPRRRNRSRRSARDRAEARRAGRARARGRGDPRPAAPARRRRAGPVPHDARHRRTPTRCSSCATRPRTCSRKRSMRLHPGVKIAIGPPIADGFYYDFEFPEPISEADLEAIEDEIRREIAEGREWTREEVSREEAVARFEAESQPYKVELARGCRGRHLALHAGRVHGSLPRPAPPERRSDQGREADEPRGRLLARRREATRSSRGSTAPRSTRRPTSTPTSSGSSRRARATIAGSGRSSTSSTSPTTLPARRSGTRRGWCSGTRSRISAAARTADAATSR